MYLQIFEPSLLITPVSAKDMSQVGMFRGEKWGVAIQPEGEPQLMIFSPEK